MNFNNGTDTINGLSRMNSASSTAPLTETKKTTRTACSGFATLSVLERCLIILNIGLIVILLPLVFSSIHKLHKIEDSLDYKLDNHTSFLVMIDDIWKAAQDIHTNVGGINETQLQMKEKQSVLDKKMAKITCSIGSKNSGSGTSTNVKSKIVQIIPSASEGATFKYMVKCSGPCKNMKIDLKVNRDADLYASTDSIIRTGSSSNPGLCKSRSDNGEETCPIFNAPSDTFYTLVHSYKAHDRGTLTFTGSNLISVSDTSGSSSPSQSTSSPVTTTTEVSPAYDQCQENGLYYEIDTLKSTIEQANQETKDFIEDKLDNHTSSLQKVDDILEKSNSIEEMVDGINSTHQEIKGKQFTLEHKLDEIVCSMGVNSSYLPATTETTSPISKVVPAGTRGNKYYFKVNCKGACASIGVQLDVGNNDADLFVSKNMSTSSSSRLCKSAEDSGRERCPTPRDTTVSTFYTIVHAYRSHPSGTLTFTGSNLISATNANQTEESMSVVTQHCEQIGLFDKMDDLQSAIEESQLDAQGNILGLEGKVDTTLANVDHLMSNSASNERKFDDLETTHLDIKNKQIELDQKIGEIIDAIEKLKSVIPAKEASNSTDSELS